MTLWPVLLLFICLFLGVPVIFSMLIAVIPYAMADPFISASVIAQRLVSNCESISLMAIPFFITAGSIMNYSGISEKLLKLADGLVGHLTGGLGQVNVLLSTLMGGISGSGAADAAMECKLLVPEMLKYGYDKGFSAAVTAASACITPIIPPGVNLVLYACLAECSVGRMLASGYIPGILLCLSLMLVVYIISKKRHYKGVRDKMMSGKELLKLLRESLWALFLPFGLILALRVGVCTPTEGGALMCVYSLFVGKFIYKKMSFSQLPAIIRESALATAPVLLMLCGASVFSFYMSWESIPAALAKSLVSFSSNKYVFLIICNLFFFVCGCFGEAMALMIIAAPLLVPIATQLGVDVIQFGLIMALNTGLAAVTPPIGSYIFLTAGTLKMETEDLVKELWPFLIAAFSVLLLVTFVPWFSTFIPNLIYGA